MLISEPKPSIPKVSAGPISPRYVNALSNMPFGKTSRILRGRRGEGRTQWPLKRMSRMKSRRSKPAAHIEESMKYAHQGVGDADIHKYRDFALSLQQSRAFGAEFRFSEAGSGGTAVGSDPFAPATGGTDDDDLYSQF